MKNQEDICRELNRIVSRHLQALSAYTVIQEAEASRDFMPVLISLERLMLICTCPPRWATQLLFEEARHHKKGLEDFLSLMNQDCRGVFQETEVGKIWTMTDCWCRTAAKFHPSLTFSEVWKLLTPVEPDYLHELGNHLYEARWWPPVPMMDVEILQRTDQIEVQGEPFEPEQIPGGIALRFVVCGA